MRIVLITDLEGVSGVTNMADWLSPGSRYYAAGRALLTAEVNAAIEGFAEAGADEFYVQDGHGHGAIDALQLDERATYSRGWPARLWLDGSFDAIAWVGQHAKAGTEKAHIPHTGSHIVRDQRLNNISIGEFGELAAIAGYYGIPAIFGSGDLAFTKEAKALIPGIHTAAVKEGMQPGGGDECSTEEYEARNLGAMHVHPYRARHMIKTGAYNALKDLIANPQKFKPLKIEPPYKLEIWYRKTGSAAAYQETRVHPTDLLELFSAPVMRSQTE